MEQMFSITQKRRRLPPELRRQEMIDAAAALLLKRGTLPLPSDDLRRAAGISKALIYAYFPTQHDLLNTLLKRELQALVAMGICDAVRKMPIHEAALLSALIYFDRIADVGPLAHIILRERYMTGHVSEENRHMRDRIVLALVRAGRRELMLTAKENIAAFNLVIAIPEEAGRLAFVGDMERSGARDLCARLVESSLAALAPAIK